MDGCAVNMAILDEYQNVVLLYADWSRVARKAEITVFIKPCRDRTAHQIW